jgi:uncharacterized protein (TIGR03435 family)
MLSGQTIGFTLALAVMLAGPAHTQTRTPSSFDVASVRIATPGTRETERITPGRVEFLNVALRSLVLKAFRIELFQLVGPDWLAEARFDIRATYPSGVTPEQLPDMLQTLLVERFGLVAHREPRPVEAYELRVDRNGLRISEVSERNDLDASIESSVSERVTRDADDKVVRRRLLTAAEGSVGLTVVSGKSMYANILTTQGVVIDATRITMAEFAKLLTRNLGKPVIDLTDLAGLYRFKVKLDWDASIMNRVSRGALASEAFAPTGISTSEAVAGLGLRLQPRGAPFDIVVIDAIERTPTAN